MSIRDKQASALNTFIVRFWRQRGADETHWHGQAQHIQSGERLTFADEDALLAFLRHWVQIPAEGRGERTLKEEGGGNKTQVHPDVSGEIG